MFGALVLSVTLLGLELSHCLYVITFIELKIMNMHTFGHAMYTIVGRENHYYNVTLEKK